MASHVMSSSTLELDHSKDEKRSQYHERQIHSEDEKASTNVDAHEFSQTRDSQQQASSRESSSYSARKGPNHEFKSYLLDEK